MDVAGVAAASIISQYLSAFLILRALVKVGGDYALRLSKLRFDKRMAGYLIQIGLPAGLQNGIFQVANLFIQAGVNTFDATMVAGNSAAANADALLYDSMAAFYTACSSFIAQNFGARKKKRILQTYLICLFYSFITSLLLGVGIYLARYPFLYLFTSDKAVVEAGITRLSIMALSYSASAFMDASIAASRGLGKTAVPTFVVVMGSCVFRIIWIYTIFAYFHTIQSLYILYVFSWGITAIAENIYFFHVYRHTLTEKKRIVLIKKTFRCSFFNEQLEGLYLIISKTFFCSPLRQNKCQISPLPHNIIKTILHILVNVILFISSHTTN